MARRIGYSLVDLSTAEEVAWNPTLPWSIEYTLNDTDNSIGNVNIDRAGLEFPYGENPKYRVVERWVTDEPADGYIGTGFEKPIFDGGRINVTGIYEPVDPTIEEERQRKASIENDADTQELLQKLRSHSSQQIDDYIQNHVTDLASAKQVLARIAKVLTKVV